MRLILRMTEKQRRAGAAMCISLALHGAVVIYAPHHAPHNTGPHASALRTQPIQVALMSLAQAQPDPPTPTSIDLTRAGRAAAPKSDARLRQPAWSADEPQKTSAAAPAEPSGFGATRADAVSQYLASALDTESSPAHALSTAAQQYAPPAHETADNEVIHKAQPDYAYNPPPEYPLLLREQGIGGVVWLKVRVEADGRPGEIKLAKGSGLRLLDEAALHAVRRWRFFPARQGEQTLASWVEFPIRFSLNS